VAKVETLQPCSFLVIRITGMKANGKNMLRVKEYMELQSSVVFSFNANFRVISSVNS
jgi:hypothetical protein